MGPSIITLQHRGLLGYNIESSSRMRCRADWVVVDLRPPLALGRRHSYTLIRVEVHLEGAVKGCIG